MSFLPDTLFVLSAQDDTNLGEPSSLLIYIADAFSASAEFLRNKFIQMEMFCSPSLLTDQRNLFECIMTGTYVLAFFYYIYGMYVQILKLI